MSLHEELSARAETLREKSSELSDLLERVEKFFQDLPGKVPAQVGDRSGNFLSFTRSGKTWVLQYSHENKQVNATKLPVEAKIKAAPLVPKLLEVMQQEQAKRIGELETAIQCLSSLPIREDK